MCPIFRRHPRSKHVLVLAGYNGHGVALFCLPGEMGRRKPSSPAAAPPSLALISHQKKAALATKHWADQKGGRLR